MSLFGYSHLLLIELPCEVQARCSNKIVLIKANEARREVKVLFSHQRVSPKCSQCSPCQTKRECLMRQISSLRKQLGSDFRAFTLTCAHEKHAYFVY